MDRRVAVQQPSSDEDDYTSFGEWNNEELKVAPNQVSANATGRAEPQNKMSSQSLASVLTFGNNSSTKFLSRAAKEDKILQPKARRQPTSKINLLGINEEQKYNIDFDNSSDKVLPSTLQKPAAAGVMFSSRDTNSNEEKEKEKMRKGARQQCFERSGREVVVDGAVEEQEEEVKEPIRITTS